MRPLIVPGLVSILALACNPPVASKANDTDGGTESTAADTTTDAGEPSIGEPDDTGSGDSNMSTGEAPQDDGAGSAGQDGSGGNSGGGTGNPVMLGLCALPCEADADCCPFGALGCPGDAYPNNWSCVEGACSFGGCASDADCDGLLGLGPEECHEVAGVPTCVAPCDGGGCGLGTQCVGEADDATMFCAAAVDAPCESDDDCENAGICAPDTGICGCASDEDCADAGMICATM